MADLWISSTYVDVTSYLRGFFAVVIAYNFVFTFFHLLILLFSQEVGYQHGKTVFGVWSRTGVLDKMLRDRQETYKTKTSDVSVQFNCTALQKLHDATRNWSGR